MKFAIIGYPVEHSLSPEMHEAGFKALGLEAQYHRLPVQPANLAESIGYLQENHYSGWNVTYPLKEEILPFLDEVTPEALHIGAVNTVKAVDGLLVGHNTDGGGFIQSLVTKGFALPGKKAVILGAGGAAKAIAVALAEQKTEVLILNRRPEKAGQLAGHICGLGGKASSGVLEAGSWLQNADLLIQTTPVGMSGEDYVLDLKGINPAAWVVDLIYHPAETSFLADAARQGCQTMNGLDMLLYQGVLAWKFWLNLEAPVAAMRRALLLRSTDPGEKGED